VQLVKNNLENITGRVLLQVSPRYIDDKSAIIQHCYRLSGYFHDAGILNDRFAIKLPFTGAAACAAAELNTEGIRTLATSVFGLEQAIAASQSGCLFISPYYNGMTQPSSKTLYLTTNSTLEIAAYSNLPPWSNTPDPALEVC
jgi:transaldolase